MWKKTKRREEKKEAIQFVSVLAEEEEEEKRKGNVREEKERERLTFCLLVMFWRGRVFCSKCSFPFSVNTRFSFLCTLTRLFLFLQ